MAAPTPPPAPNPLLGWWESLPTWQNLVISFPVLSAATFLLNLGPFAQPLVRSALYGLIEGGILAGLLVVATNSERSRRHGQGGGSPGS